LRWLLIIPVVRGDKFNKKESDIRATALTVEMQQVWEPTRELGTATARVSLVIAQPQLLVPVVARKAKEGSQRPGA
jgi:hypothetical protein